MSHLPESLSIRICKNIFSKWIEIDPFDNVWPTLLSWVLTLTVLVTRATAVWCGYGCCTTVWQCVGSVRCRLQWSVLQSRWALHCCRRAADYCRLPHQHWSMCCTLWALTSLTWACRLSIYCSIHTPLKVTHDYLQALEKWYISWENINKYPWLILHCFFSYQHFRIHMIVVIFTT